jgi:hypothetical protein
VRVVDVSTGTLRRYEPPTTRTDFNAEPNLNFGPLVSPNVHFCEYKFWRCSEYLFRGKAGKPARLNSADAVMSTVWPGTMGTIEIRNG